MLAHREKINLQLQEIIDRHTEPWGIKVTAVEVRDVVLPDSMKRAMAKQAEAERERRAKVINAEGEFQAAEKMVQAAAMIAAQPIALQLRFLQTMAEIASEHNTTTFLPLPIDLFRVLPQNRQDSLNPGPAEGFRFLGEPGSFSHDLTYLEWPVCTTQKPTAIPQPC